ncbi:helix-turn-helix transcriptional regulator, partial [Dysosmobacter sp.]
MASVGKHIRHLRTARGLTQEQLAEMLFVTRQTVSAWETGRAQPDLETLERIAAALETDVTEVIYGVSRPQALG